MTVLLKLVLLETVLVVRTASGYPPGYPLPNPCINSSVDAMVTMDISGEKRTFAYQGEFLWELISTGVRRGYPQLIRDIEDYRNLSGSLDAVLSDTESGTVYFFNGSQYWRRTGLEMDDGFPQPISSGFPGIPDNIDAAFKWARNGKMYFFKGSQYWRFDDKLGTTGRPGVSDKYPRPISVWRGVPNNIDSALTYKNKRTYFFKGNVYYRFNDTEINVDPGYPRSIGKHWFGCSS